MNKRVTVGNEKVTFVIHNISITSFEISLTSFNSKIFERFVVNWLMEYISDKIDQKQFGGKSGCSTTHYLIEFISFILYNWDLAEKHAVLSTLIDFSKAFNRINHNTIIIKLADMSVPSWLLKIVMGFLENRTLQVRYKGEVSET